MWDLPGPGLEPVSPALAGGFLTTVPPGKSPEEILKVSNKIVYAWYVEGEKGSKLSFSVCRV